MASSGVKVKGLKELNRAFRRLDKKLVAELGDELKAAAEPVAKTAQQKVSRYQGASVRTIRAKRMGLRVVVEQSARKKTGLRGDFGALQMHRVLIPALEERSEEVIREVDKVLGRWGGEEGF